MRKLFILLALFLFCMIGSAEAIDIYPESTKDIWGNSVVYSPDGKHVVSGAPNNTVVIWNMEYGKQVHAFEGHNSVIGSVEYSQNGNYILSTSWDGTSKLWDANTGKELRTFNGITAGMQRSRTVLFSPDSNSIVAVTSTGIKIWNVKDGHEILNLPDVNAFALAVSPNGNRIAAGFNNGIKIWDAKTGQELRNFQGPVSNTISFSHDSRRIVAASGTNIKIWDAESLREMRTLPGPGAMLTSVAYSPDDKYIVASSYSKAIKIWESNGKEVLAFTEPSISLSVAYSPDSKYIVTALTDGTIRLLDAANGIEIAQYVSFDDGEWICITPDGFYNASPRGDAHLNALVDDEVYSVDQFRQTFYQPSVVRARLNGQLIQNQTVFAPPEIVLNQGDSGRGFSQIKTSPGTVSDKYNLFVLITDKNQPIKSVRILLNGRRIGNNELRTMTGVRGLVIEDAELSASAEKTVEFTLPLTLDNGRNVIEVIASNGFAESRKNIELNYQKQGKVELPNLWILSIGVNHYKRESIPNLNYCVNDAREIVNAFKAQEGKRYTHVNTLLITDGESIAPTARNIRDNLKYLSNASSNDVVLLFLAGHGVSNSDGLFFFLPSDADFSPDGAVRENMVISTAEIFSVLNAQGNRLVFIDACHSGGLSSKTGAVDNNRLVRSLMESNAFVFTSSKENELSQERKEYEHGVFTYGIIKGLNPDNIISNNGVISMLQLSSYVSREVKSITDDKQHPGPYTLGFDDFPVAQIK